MANTIFSLKTLGWCWAGLLATVGSGAVALQVTMPAPAPAPVAVAATAPVPVVAPALAPIAPVPFQNRSLLAMLPPPTEHMIERPRERLTERSVRVAAALPVPPMPPAPRIPRVEQRRIVTVYAAAPAYAPPPWGRMAPYAAEYAPVRPYAYAAPPTYYGW